MMRDDDWKGKLMKVFVTGASGYIGSAVSAALARAGHQVSGLVRSEEKAKAAAGREVQPVLSSMQDSKVLREMAARCQVIIHCASDSSVEGWTLEARTIRTLLSAAERAGQPRLIIYTSGVWIYGDTGTGTVDESSPLNPLPFSKPRRKSEEEVLEGAAGLVRTLVLRPGCVYGGRGGLTAAWFERARFVGDGNIRWAMVHVEDLAAAYVLAAESSFSAEVFNVTDRSRFTVRECAEAASRAAGGDGKVESISVSEAVEQMGAWAACLALNQHVDSSLAARRLGWRPRHGGFVDGVERYYEAWKALTISR